MVASGYGAQDRVAKSGDTMSGALHISPGCLTAGVVVLTDGPLIAVDASQGNHFRVTLGGNRSLSAPVNVTDGQKITFEVTQDGTGSRRLAYDPVYEFGADIPQPVLSTAPGTADFIGFLYSAAAANWCCVGVARGF